MKNSDKKGFNFFIALSESSFMTKLMIFLFIVLFALIVFIIITQDSNAYDGNYYTNKKDTVTVSKSTSTATTTATATSTATATVTPKETSTASPVETSTPSETTIEDI